MNIRQLFDPATSTYTYLLWDEASAEAALIDSVKEQVDRDEQLFADLKLKPKYLLETHIHADHITGAGILRERFGAKVTAAVWLGSFVRSAKAVSRFSTNSWEPAIQSTRGRRPSSDLILSASTPKTPVSASNSSENSRTAFTSWP